MTGRITRMGAIGMLICAGLTTAGIAGAVDMRDWGRKFPASQRFVVLSQFGNQAVLDKETQLVWERQPYATPMATRGSAARACQILGTGDRRGWRLPFLHELESLVQPNSLIGSLPLPAGHPFQNVPLGHFWTATPTTEDGVGYVVALQEAGYIYGKDVGASGFRWCVRGGGPGPEF